MQSLRQRLLACSEMHEMHTLLNQLDLCDEMMPPVEQTIGKAMKLIQDLPPEALLARLGRYCQIE